ncbi:MAG: class I SAM-dependent methyltransferase [Nannocystaceae bacterium]
MTANAYDAIPYEDYPVTETHVDALYLASRAAGLDAAHPEQARVLELGCAHGVNLMPMAFHLPQASLLGVDLSPRQIEQGRQRVHALGLDNLELRCADVLDLHLGSRRFDYIIAHGLYSWVPEPVRARVLGLFREYLAPSGVAYLSYNAMPAWGIRGAIGRALREAVGPAGTPTEQVRQARAALAKLEQVQPLRGTAEGALLRGEIEALRHKPDSYLLHEYLVPDSRAFYLREVVERASRAGLQWVGDVAPSSLSAAETAQARRELGELRDDPLAIEQLVDIVGFRQFRASLLCRDDDSRGEPQNASQRLREGFVAALPAEHDDEVPAETRAVLAALGQRWPQEWSLAELSEQVAIETEQLVPQLAALVDEGRVQRRARRLPARAPSERPKASVLSRFEASYLPFVTTPMHEHAPLDAFHAALIGHLDGQRTAGELVEVLLQDIAAGRLRLASEKPPQLDELGPALRRTVDGALQRLGQAGLLLG